MLSNAPQARKGFSMPLCDCLQRGFFYLYIFLFLFQFHSFSLIKNPKSFQVHINRACIINKCKQASKLTNWGAKMKQTKCNMYIQNPEHAFIAKLPVHDIKEVMKLYSSGLITLTEAIMKFGAMGLHVQDKSSGFRSAPIDGSGSVLDDAKPVDKYVSWAFVKIQEEEPRDGQFFSMPHLRIEFTIQYTPRSLPQDDSIRMSRLNVLFIMYGMLCEAELIANDSDTGAMVTKDVEVGATIRKKLQEMGFEI